VSAGTILASGSSVLDSPRDVRFTFRLREGTDDDFVMTFERAGVVSFFPIPAQVARDIAAALGLMAEIAAFADAIPPMVTEVAAAMT
jgi:hypothetical protein